MNNVKSIFKSKTMWLNSIMAVLAIVAYINPELLTALGIAPESQQKALTFIGALTGLLNLVLRMLTTGGVAINPAKASEVK